MTLHSFTDSAEIMPALAEFFITTLKPISKPVVILAGGTTYLPLYALFLEKYSNALDWSAITFFLSDERLVPVDHPDSNYGSIKKHFVDPFADVGIALTAHPFSLSVYQALLASYDHFDLSLLGLGTDGHTASLFPGKYSPDEEAMVIKTEPGLAPFHQRLSLSLNALAKSTHTVVVAAGESKKEITERLVSQKNQDPSLPLSYLEYELFTDLV